MGLLRTFSKSRFKAADDRARRSSGDNGGGN
jgi:hypothetical protein